MKDQQNKKARLTKICKKVICFQQLQATVIVGGGGGGDGVSGGKKKEIKYFFKIYKKLN